MNQRSGTALPLVAALFVQTGGVKLCPSCGHPLSWGHRCEGRKS